jgi:hypothetical protein
MNNQFKRTALLLSKGHLGNIALFIVFMGGVASLVFGFATVIVDSNYSIKVWFLILFPLIVFFVFMSQVNFSHAKGYLPSADTDVETVKHLCGNSDFDKQQLQTNFQQVSVSTSPFKVAATGHIYWFHVGNRYTPSARS